ncbi:MAG: PH domain-containing protein [Oscillospiraceae bacterium]
MKKYLADKTSLSLLRVVAFILTAALIFLDFYFLYIIPLLMWILIGIIVLAFFAIIIIWLPLYFMRAIYCISAEIVVRNTGFFLQMKQVMRVDAIQYFTVVKTPFSRFTGLNFLVINALGGSIVLNFLSQNDIDEISKTLAKAINERPQ